MLLVTVVLAILVSFTFCTGFRISLFIPTKWKRAAGIFIGIALNLSINLGGTDIFTTVNIPIHDRGMFFRLFRSSFISFLSVLQFTECKYYVSFVRFTTKNRPHLWVVCGVPLLSFISPNAVLLVSRNMIDFVL